MPTTKTKSAGSSKHADFLDATSDSESGTQSRREYTDTGSLLDHEVEHENSPVPANRGGGKTQRDCVPHKPTGEVLRTQSSYPVLTLP